MPTEALLFFMSLVVCAGLMFVMVYCVIMLSDLECDYINPIDLCQKLNQLVLPEMMTHAALCFVFLVTLDFSAVLVNAPLLAWNIHRLSKNGHRYDPTEVFRRLPVHKRESFFKMVFYLITFFYYLYRLISGLIAASPRA